jgi:hypothetical protein
VSTFSIGRGTPDDFNMVNLSYAMFYCCFWL